MVTAVVTATNHRPPITSTAPSNRMAKPDSKSEKSPKKPGRAGAKPTNVLETSPELRNTVAAIEKQFGEGAIMALGSDTATCRSKASRPAACRSTSPWAGRGFPAAA